MDIKRKLASIRKVGKISPIQGADRIEVAAIDGWAVVIAKNSVKTGDLVVYFEIDSILPEGNKSFEFMRNREEPKLRHTDEGQFVKGWLLKTIKLRKQISQGLILPKNDFDELKDVSLSEGDDVTDLLGIKKYEAPVNGNQKNNGVATSGGRSFPSYLIKSDQDRIQNYMNHIINKLDECGTYEVTHKLDGSSATYSHYNGSYAICSRNLSLRLPKQYENVSTWESFKNKVKEEFTKLIYVFTGKYHRSLGKFKTVESNSTFHKIQDKYKILDGLKAYYDYAINNNLEIKNIALQGELIAPNIQKNYECVEEEMFFVYAIQNVDKREFLLPEQARDIISVINNLPNRESVQINYVPIQDPNFDLANFISEFKNEDGSYDIPSAVNKILKFAEQRSIIGKSHNIEGLVFKSNTLNTLSFKAISNLYLTGQTDDE